MRREVLAQRKQWAQIEPHLPTNNTGPARDADRRIISGIIHMLQCGARWRDCPPDYGPARRSTIVSIAGLSASDQLSPSLLAKLPLEMLLFAEVDVN